jgi:hypothetical protein
MEEGSRFMILEDEMCLFPFQDLQILGTGNILAQPKINTLVCF